MIRFSFRKGLVFIELNTRWQLNRRLVNNKLQFESELGEIKVIDDQEVLRRWHKSEWQVSLESLSTLGNVIYLATPQDLYSLPEKWQKIATRRKCYIDAINPDINKYNPTLWQQQILLTAKEITDPKPPCSSSVHNWWRRYKITQSITSLTPQVKGRARREDPRRIIFDEAVETIYLNNQKLPKLMVVKRINYQINQLNLTRDDFQKIPRLGRSTIYRWLDELRQDIVDASRLGAEVARVKYRMVMGGLKVERILDRIEIDNTPLNIHVIDTHSMLPLGKPWLTYAIDRKSNMVMGYYISFSAPSAYAILQCISMSIFPKDQLLARFPDIKGVWPACGIPVEIYVDNGMDLHANAVNAAGKELGISIMFCPVKNPQMKAAIERSLGTINRDLIHTLPGTVFSNVNERGDYPSEALSAISMDTLIHVITKWIVEISIMTPHRGINTTPLLKWQESAKTTIIHLPALPQQLQTIIGIPASRVVFHYGIELEGLHYNNSVLQEIRRISGVNMKVKLKFYEDQVNSIHVFDPYKKEYFEVNCVFEEYSEGLQRDIHRLTRAEARKKFGELYNNPQLLESLHDIQKIVKDAVNSKKMATRKKAANLLMHDSLAVFNHQDPMLEARKPIKSAKLKPPESLPNGLEDQLPDLLNKINNDLRDEEQKP